jgi:hypothetical protein
MRVWHQMAHRKQEADVIGWTAQLAGFVMLISLFFPAVHRALAEFGWIVVGLSVLVVASLIGFGIYRQSAWRSGMRTAAGNPFMSPTDASDRTWNDDESETTLDLLEPALRRRYPWRH